MKARYKSELPTEGLDLESLMETLFYRDEFLTLASHELKTPLTSIKLQAQVFKRNAKKNSAITYTKEQVDKMVDQVDIQTSHLINLVEKMLDISRIRSGQFHMTKNDFNVSELLHEIVLKSQANICAKIDADIFMTGDRERIAQVFTKIINNAARYGKGLPIEVKLVQRKTKISFLVTDQGAGISSEDQKRLFHRFQRAVAASEVSGLGLGLYIAREIVEAHNGKISLKSEPDKGSIFKVDFRREGLDE
ncbi:MAG: HAMP domain-containing histidine kinase [Bdellovibrionales bacterium]|nr:HAMP domain-containing histidine kinase [Bdellovibrionales bacterium]